MGISTGILFGLIPLFAWGIADLFTKQAAEKLGGIKVLFWEKLISSILLILASLFFFDLPLIPVLIFFFLLIMAFLNLTGYVTYYKALEVGLVSILNPIQASWVIFTVILSIIFLHESLSHMQMMGIISTFLGIILCSFKPQDLLQRKFTELLPGVKLDFISALCWGIYFVFAGYVVSQIGWFAPVFFMRLFVVASLFIFVFHNNMDIRIPQLKFRWYVLIIGVLDLLGWFGWAYGVQTEYVSIVSPIAAAFPLATFIGAAIFLKERLHVIQYLGFAAILGGIVVLAL